MLMYVSEEEVTPRKKSLLMAATQAYVGEDDRWVGVEHFKATLVLLGETYLLLN